MSPRLSVVMAAYNVGPYIERAIRSVLAQSSADLELIVIDDASSDDTVSRVTAILNQDPRLVLLRQSRNLGVSAARNRGLDVARGDWIGIVDADDWIAPQRFQRLMNEAERLGADVIADDLFIVPGLRDEPSARLMTGEPKGARIVAASHIVTHDPPELMGYGLLKPLIRRAALKETGLSYHPELRRYEDFLFVMEMAAKGLHFSLLNEPLYSYRIRAGSLTKEDPRRVLAEMKEVSARARRAARDAHDRTLERALLAREALIDRGRRYYRCIMPLKEGAHGKAILALLSDPGIWPYVARKFAVRLFGRLRHRDPLSLVLLGGTSALIRIEPSPAARTQA
jgi:glycosyltransferase involved in cell wall biosynthesis